MRISEWSSDVCSSDLLAGGEDQECGRRADQHGVEIDRERLHVALLGRMRDLGRCRRVRTGSLAGLVGVYAALDAPFDGQASSERVVLGRSVSVRVEFGGCRIIQKKITNNNYMH